MPTRKSLKNQPPEKVKDRKPSVGACPIAAQGAVQRHIPFDAIIEQVQAGIPLSVALRQQGVSKGSWYRMLEKDRGQADRYARAMRQALDALGMRLLLLDGALKVDRDRIKWDLARRLA